MPTLANDIQEHERQRTRRRAFVLAFAAVLIAGSLFTVLQPRVFRSSASVLMSAPTAIDEQMLEADVQGVAIQQRVLLGSDVTGQLAAQLAAEIGYGDSAATLRDQLAVTPVPETNLLELSASGSDRDVLPAIVQTWIDVYSDVRLVDIEARKAQTLREVEDKLAGLGVQLDSARASLEAFRNEHGIISMERQENAVLARLDGLNEALNTAVEDEVRSRAYLESLRSSIAAGRQVVPENERAEVEAMATQLAELRVRYDELKAQYTAEYIARDPRLRDIPVQIAELEQRLGRSYSEGADAELASAERDFAAARDSVAELERRLAEHKREVAAFNTVYAEHEALAEDLAALEELNRETQARLVAVAVNPVERYPQIAVVDWPSAQAVRVGPDYLLLLGATAAGALLAGIFAAWLYGYLHPPVTAPGYVTLSGVHMYPSDPAALEQAAATAIGENPTSNRLQHNEGDD